MSLKGIKYDLLLSDFIDAAEVLDFEVNKLNFSEDDYLLLLSSARDESRPSIYISAGIHGDEPAGPYALFMLMINRFFDSRANWHIFPMLNPYGLRNGIRENESGEDLNRDYGLGKSIEVARHLKWLNEANLRWDMSLCLHEDWEAKGYYLYDVSRNKPDDMTVGILEAVREFGPLDLSTEIDGRPASGGIISPTVSAEELRKSDEWPEAFYFLADDKHIHYTFESASEMPLEERVDQHCAAIEAAVKRCIEVFQDLR